MQRHRAEGTIPTSVRHLYYEAVMDDGCPDVVKVDQVEKGRRKPDQDLDEATIDLREIGLVKWEEIEDRTRRVIENDSYSTILDGAEDVIDCLCLDPYENGILPALVVESESAAGVLVGLAAAYRVPIIPIRGQSAGFLRTAVPAFLGDRKITVGYIGDADRAGGDIEANTLRVLTEVLEIAEWTRLALTWEQVVELNLPIQQRVDKRDGAAHPACEIEALPQRILQRTVMRFLADRLVEDLKSVREREAAERENLRSMIRGDDR